MDQFLNLKFRPIVGKSDKNFKKINVNKLLLVCTHLQPEYAHSDQLMPLFFQVAYSGDESVEIQQAYCRLFSVVFLVSLIMNVYLFIQLVNSHDKIIHIFYLLDAIQNSSVLCIIHHCKMSHRLLSNTNTALAKINIIIKFRFVHIRQRLIWSFKRVY